VAPGAALVGAAPLVGAADRYLRVWRVDHGFVSAAFGLARMLLAASDRPGAVSILDEVPVASSHYVAAQIAAVRSTLDDRAGAPTEDDLVAASGRLDRLNLDRAREAGLAVEMLRVALRWLAPLSFADGAPLPTPERRSWVQVVQERLRGAGIVPATGPAPAAFLGVTLREREVRLGLERAYRVLADLETDPHARWQLVDAANSVRPQTVT
jgi:serine/threonine-protein kinase PknG